MSRNEYTENVDGPSSNTGGSTVARDKAAKLREKKKLRKSSSIRSMRSLSSTTSERTKKSTTTTRRIKTRNSSKTSSSSRKRSSSVPNRKDPEGMTASSIMMSPKVRSHDDDQERLGKAQERIQSMFSEQRKKEQDRRKEQCTPQRHRPSSQTNATTPRGVEERKKLAQLWHERLGEPDRATMKALVHKKSQGCDLDLEDVDLLSWGNLPAMTVSSCSESSDGSDDKSAFQVVSKRTAGTEDFSALRRSASRRSICSTPLRRTGFAGDQQHDLSFSSFSSHGALEKIDADESFTSIKKSSTPKTKKKSRPSLSKALEAQKGASSSEDECESKERSKASSKKSSRSSSTRRRRDSSLGRHSIAGTSAASATLADTKKHRKSSKKKLHKDSETASLTSRSKTSSKDPFGVPPSRGPQGYVNPELQQKLKLYKKYRKSTSSLCSANSSTCGESVSHRSEDLEHIFPNFVVHGS